MKARQLVAFLLAIAALLVATLGLFGLLPQLGAAVILLAVAVLILAA